MQKNILRFSSVLMTTGFVALLAGCGTSLNRAPVEDRTPTKAVKSGSAPAAASAASAAAETKPLPGIENAGKPGYYTVKPGDTLIRVALENGQGWRDLVKWNALENPNVIEVGQVLRVVPPGIDAGSVSTRPVSAPKIETRPLDGKAGAAGSGATAAPSASGPANTAGSSAASAPASKSDDDDISWGWPAYGNLIAGFDEARNSKGLDINGKTGDAVLAAADGRVMYAGSGLRGYGNMIIIKHNAGYLSAYAHNQALLVKEDQVVRKGQKIAEMGSSDADQVKLHFEIRRQGKLLDPAKLLPAR
ncbi:peptidoglycan DD-metalloendopeptidase family protein [Roseateles koreensis]|uniref:Peptidoglycan DD-metalloendopeptidase family protein n=1 Tax=Roseateles koreensis TaxID=2987526 RepID=A0ABT5KR99_9BURK|nr:peptidoglycan DD-metalloendopeptidase family protein [Roseateles koreensis]MDC8784401.1 peptidoglycan DD-metalloendopeptidase family protein [Roseateles koreensis]